MQQKARETMMPSAAEPAPTRPPSGGAGRSPRRAGAPGAARVLPDEGARLEGPAAGHRSLRREKRELRAMPALQFIEWGYRHASRAEFAVRGLNLSIQPGEHVLLLGASGIGKSTILEGAAGLLGEDAGEIAERREDVGGASVEAVTDADGGVTEGTINVAGIPVHHAQGKMGLVLQDPDAQAIFQRIGDNVAFGPENLDVPRGQIWQRVDEALDAVGLGGIQLDRSVMHLSGGQMQRLALAGALAMQPEVLLLDEPTANLDPAGVVQVVGAVRRVLESTGATMLLVEHHADDWIDLVDRVVVLGRVGGATAVVADGTPDAVFADDSLDFDELGIWIPERYRKGAAKGEGGAVPRTAQRQGSGQQGAARSARNGTQAAAARVREGDVVLEARDLAIGRNGEAIGEHIDLKFRAGQIAALVGANGAGKSTLSLTLAGLLEPIAGEVRASDALAEGARGNWPVDWTSRQLAARISYVFQNPEHQFACSSVLDEVMLGPLRCGAGEEEARAKAQGLLERFHLAQYERANPYTLSGGEKRRLTVAAALAAAPRVLILDEPTFGQDRCTWREIVELIGSLRADGVAVIVVTHDRELVDELGATLIELTPQFATAEWTVAEEGGTEPLAGNRGMAPVPQHADEGGTGAGSKGNLLGPVPQHAGAGGTGGRDLEPIGTRHDAASGTTTVTVTPVIERYEPPKPSSRSPFLASLNPVYRLFGAFLASLPLLLSLDWVSAAVACALEFGLLWAVGITPWRAVKSTWPIFIGAPCSALAVLLYGKSGGAVLWDWGWVHVTERSAELAVATGLRIIAIGVPAIIAVLGIDATDLADGFSEILHLPDRFVYGGLAGLRLFSVLQDDWTALTASRRSRGLGDDSAIRRFLPQAFALLVLSIRRSTTLATAMQARGFGGDGPRSHARQSTVRGADHAFCAVCLAIPVVALVCAACAGTFSFFGN